MVALESITLPAMIGLTNVMRSPKLANQELELNSKSVGTPGNNLLDLNG